MKRARARNFTIGKADSARMREVLAISRRQIGSGQQAAFLRRSAERGDLLIASDGGETLGFAIWNREFYGRPFIWLLQVAPEHRQRGIARALISAISLRLRRSEQLFSSTNKSNLIARRTFEALGFVGSGRIENLDPGDPEIVYCLRGAPKRISGTKSTSARVPLNPAN